jgi:RHS repeat-associated protein
VQTPADGSATQSTAYVWGTSLLRQTRGGQGTLYAQASSDLIPLEGQLGTVLGAIDANGNLVEQYERDAFGNALDDTTAHAQLAHQYTGEYFDQDIGLQYNRARWYGAQIGLFLSVDPAKGKQQEPRSLNRYAYAQSEPVNGIDPSGFEDLPGLITAENAEGELESNSIGLIQNLYNKFGCDIAMYVAEEAVTSGIYVLIDTVTGGLYVGQSVDMNRRYLQHLKEAEDDVRKAWKANLKPLMQFPMFRNGQLLNRAEQLLIDVLEKQVKLLNTNAVIGPKNALRSAYEDFRGLICRDYR